jgi:branched-chain amino acid transport system permease protein
LFCVFGGVQYFWGAAVGAVILSLLPTFFSGLAEWYQIIYGLIFVILMIVRPQGLIGRSTGSLLPRLIRRRATEPDTPSTAREEQTVG